MAPIHDTDIAEKRWSKAEWKHYELWEKLEHRLKRRKYLWILATLIVFMMLSAVPTVRDRWPKWVSLHASRILAREVNAIKRQAGLEHVAYRIRFPVDGSLEYIVEMAESCGAAEFKESRTSSLVPNSQMSRYKLLWGSQGVEIGLPGLLESFCYDPQLGSQPARQGKPLVGFAVAPVKDLTVDSSAGDCRGICATNGWRTDRISVVLLNGLVAEASFE